MKRANFKRVCNSYPSDSRTLSQRIRQMLFMGVPLGENPDVKHDFQDSSDGTGSLLVDFDSDIHNDVFDKLEHAQYISHLNAERAIEKSASESSSSEASSVDSTQESE